MNTVSSYEGKYEVVNFAPIHEHKLLLGFKHREGKKPMWIPLGGKKESGENDYQCLLRELTEETRNNAKRLLENIELFGAFVGSTPNGNIPLLSTVYVGYVDKILKPNSEIQVIKAFSHEDIINDPLVSEVTRKTAMALHEKGLID